MLRHRQRARAHDEVVHAQLDALRLELGVEHLAQFQEGIHVEAHGHLVVRDRALALDEPARDRLAHAADGDFTRTGAGHHGHARCRRRRRRSHDGHGGHGCRPALAAGRRLDVTLDDAAAGARAAQRVDVDPELFRHAARHRRDPGARTRVGVRTGHDDGAGDGDRGLGRSSAHSGRGRSRRGRRRCSRGLATRRRGILALDRDDRLGGRAKAEGRLQVATTTAQVDLVDDLREGRRDGAGGRRVGRASAGGGDGGEVAVVVRVLKDVVRGGRVDGDIAVREAVDAREGEPTGVDRRREGTDIGRADRGDDELAVLTHGVFPCG